MQKTHLVNGTLGYVSIRARRLGRAMRHGLFSSRAYMSVSIRARRLGRAMRFPVHVQPSQSVRFNPRPAVRPGDALMLGDHTFDRAMFQSAPGG